MIPPQEPQTQQGKTAQFYLKWMMVAATVFIAIAAGIYTGTAVSLSPDPRVSYVFGA